MNQTPSVIVNKRGGFFSAIVYGLFGSIMVAMVCGTGIALYAIHVADSHVGRVITMSGGILAALPEWRTNLPPALADALNDRREPGYRENLDVAVRLETVERVSSSSARRWDRRSPYQAVVEVKNNGSETVSLMSLRLTLENNRDVPVWEASTYAATPLAIESEWRGPLLPGAARKIPLSVWLDDVGDRDLKARVEVTDLRVWKGQLPLPETPAKGKEVSAVGP